MTVVLVDPRRPALVPVEVENIWPDPTGVRKSCPVFRLPALSGDGRGSRGRG